MAYDILLNQVQSDFLSKKNVVAVGLGKKWTNGIDSNKDALLVFVSKKESKDKLSVNDFIPSEIDGHLIDVVGKSGIFESLNIQRTRPISPGYSCGHLWTTAGTIGGFFEDRQGDIVALSNNHVLAASNLGIRGHVMLQPGVYDNKNWNNNIVGNLKFYRPLVGKNGVSFDAAKWHHIYGYNVEDSAIAVISNPEAISYELPNIGLINDFRYDVKINEIVKKVGRTTQNTTGQVIATNAIVNVQYNQNIYNFREQIITTNMAQGGDSGSLLIDKNNNVVGLLFAGSDTMTIHNNIIHPKSTYGLKIINVNNIRETKNFNMKIDGVNNTSYDETMIMDAMDFARRSARNGKTVEINLSYTAEPE